MTNAVLKIMESPAVKGASAAVSRESSDFARLKERLEKSAGQKTQAQDKDQKDVKQK